MTTRRLVITRSAAVIGAASTGLLLPQIVRAQSSKVRVGFMLPYTGTFASWAWPSKTAFAWRSKSKAANSAPRGGVLQGGRRIQRGQGC